MKKLTIAALLLTFSPAYAGDAVSGANAYCSKKYPSGQAYSDCMTRLVSPANQPNSQEYEASSQMQQYYRQQKAQNMQCAGLAVMGGERVGKAYAGCAAAVAGGNAYQQYEAQEHQQEVDDRLTRMEMQTWMDRNGCTGTTEECNRKLKR